MSAVRKFNTNLKTVIELFDEVLDDERYNDLEVMNDDIDIVAISELIDKDDDTFIDEFHTRSKNHWKQIADRDNNYFIENFSEIILTKELRSYVNEDQLELLVKSMVTDLEKDSDDYLGCLYELVDAMIDNCKEHYK